MLLLPCSKFVCRQHFLWYGATKQTWKTAGCCCAMFTGVSFVTSGDKNGLLLYNLNSESVLSLIFADFRRNLADFVLITFTVHGQVPPKLLAWGLPSLNHLSHGFIQLENGQRKQAILTRPRIGHCLCVPVPCVFREIEEPGNMVVGWPHWGDSADFRYPAPHLCVLTGACAIYQVKKKTIVQ